MSLFVLARFVCVAAYVGDAVGQGRVIGAQVWACIGEGAKELGRVAVAEGGVESGDGARRGVG